MIDLAARQTYIGGTDSAAILGISPWKTPFDVWMDKTGQAEPTPDNDYMYWGRMLEPVLREAYQQKTGRTVELPPTIKHPVFDCIGGNLDGMAAGRVVEFKTAAFSKGWGDAGTDDIPPYYITQCQHYMMLTHAPVADVGVLIGGNDFRIYHVEADKELQEMLLDESVSFWRRYVEAYIKPPITQLKDIQRAYPKSLQNALTAKQEIIIAIESLKEIKKQLSELETAAEEREALIKGFLQENDTLVDDNQKVLATWKSAKGAIRFDAKNFEAENPELYQKYAYAANGSRRFLLK